MDSNKIKYYLGYKQFMRFTAVEQAVACTPVTQWARVRSPVGTSFLGEVFSGFSSPVRQMSGSFRSPWFPEHHLAIIIIIIISAFLDE